MINKELEERPRLIKKKKKKYFKIKIKIIYNKNIIKI